MKMIAEKWLIPEGYRIRNIPHHSLEKWWVLQKELPLWRVLYGTKLRSVVNLTFSLGKKRRGWGKEENFGGWEA